MSAATATVTPQLHTFDWAHLVRPSLVIQHASVCFNTYWKDGERLVICVVWIMPKYLDPIQKEFRNASAQVVIDQVTEFLENI